MRMFDAKRKLRNTNKVLKNLERARQGFLINAKIGNERMPDQYTSILADYTRI